MRPETLQKLEEAAQELWAENPELRAQYNHNFEAYFQSHRDRIEALAQWENDPQVRQEFGGDCALFLTYKRHEAAGSIRLIGRPGFTGPGGHA